MPTDQIKGENYFIHEGNVWRIGFGEEKGSFPDVAYIRCIARLLIEPGKSIPCIELSQVLTGKPAGIEVMTKERLDKEGLNSPNFVLKVNTDKTRRQYKKALDVLYERKETCIDREEYDQINDKIFQLEAALKERPIMDKNYKRAQNNIRKHINEKHMRP